MCKSSVQYIQNKYKFQNQLNDETLTSKDVFWSVFLTVPCSLPMHRKQLIVMTRQHLLEDVCVCCRIFFFRLFKELGQLVISLRIVGPWNNCVNTIIWRGITFWVTLLLPAVPPVILRLAEPEQRHDTCIEFTVRGYPHPKLRWFHKQKEILQNEYIRTEMDFYQDYLEGCLTFQNPTHINNGNYTLEASNPLGTVTKTVYGHFLLDPGLNDVGEWTTFAMQLFFFVLVAQLTAGSPHASLIVTRV